MKWGRLAPDRQTRCRFTLGIQGWQYHLTDNEHFAVSTAATIVGLESQVPSIYRTQYPALIDPEIYGFNEWETEFFDLHITSDEVHGERLLTGYRGSDMGAATPRPRHPPVCTHGVQLEQTRSCVRENHGGASRDPFG